ncbi:MAG: hypothetical protein DCC58_11085 [Chloroflexi bacterium]|nr:MAG: hypothetical protein DCC58_11085 [Chloroflexota bacterium]
MAEQAQPAANPMVEAMLAQVRAALQWELSEEEAAVVRGRIEGSLKMAETLRAFPLTNADEPDFVFIPHREG